ncbi:MAG TPA: glycosyltransferase family 4 protein [Cytophagaceae bacterium]|jgi:glycosyltransferase involved in cell wall biosynthesis|nr:glycosyltransferase family 4 protein [Cytophagaceae bacterium]
MDPSNRRLKILHTENAMSYTGGFKALYDYCIHEAAIIESIIILPVGSKCTQYFEKDNIKVYEIPFVEIGRSVKKNILYFPFLFYNAWRIKKIAQREKVDILHSNDLYNMTLYITKYLFQLNIPLVTHLRLMPASYPGVLYRLFRKIHLCFSDKLIAVSFAVKEAYNNSPCVTVVYDIIEKKNKHAEYKFHYNPERPFRFLYLSNFTKGKGQELAIKAFSILLQKNNNVTLTFAGGTMNKTSNETYLNELKALVVTLGLQNKIYFEGFVSDVEATMKQNDAVLNFSYSESFSFSCFEALKFGLPLIASDCGGPKELFENNISGLLVPNHQPEAMAEAMYKLSTQPELCLNISGNSRKNIDKILREQGNCHNLTKIFLNL